MDWKKFFMGEPMPSKDDPRYKELHENSKAAGEKFAKYSGLAWLGQRVVRFSDSHRLFFVCFVFSLVLFLGVYNITKLVRASVRHDRHTEQAAVRAVDSVMIERINNR